jgi:dephospho-CoA kinase
VVIAGVTGGSGAGKSALLDCWRAQGAFTIDADAVYHTLLETDTALQAALRARFGTCERRALAGIVFGSAAALAELNAVTHPYVLAAVKRELSGARAPVAAVEALYLLESGLRELCHVTVAVTAPPEKRLKRATLRDGLDEGRIAQRLAAQKPDVYFAENCDIVIENNAGRAAFAKRARRAYERVATWNKTKHASG